MRVSSVSVAKEGWAIIFVCTLACVLSALLGFAWLTLVCFALCLFSLNFFRDPERVTPKGKGLAVSPADGKVISVAPAVDPVSGEERMRVCIFMNVANVHVNRSPVDGVVERIVYHPGKFINASFDKASEHNERNTLVVRTAEGEAFTFVQIAGLIARRIVCWAEEGDEVARGQRFGLIKFGSRLDVYLPSTYHATVTVGEGVFAGQTVIATSL